MVKKSGVDDLREDIRHTRDDLGDTVVALKEKSDTKTKAVGWASAAVGLLAGAGAIVALRWRKARKAPKSRAERAWREMKRQTGRTAGRIRKTSGKAAGRIRRTAARVR